MTPLTTQIAALPVSDDVKQALLDAVAAEIAQINRRLDGLEREVDRLTEPPTQYD